MNRSLMRKLNGIASGLGFLLVIICLIIGEYGWAIYNTIVATLNYQLAEANKDG